MNKEYILSRIKIDPDTKCWIWTKSLMKDQGYGQLVYNKKFYTAHRFSYLAFKGEIPKGLLIRHICHNKLCCNPDHLLLGTDKDNYHDSLEVHKAVNLDKSYKWIIGNNTYYGIRSACKGTGINHGVLIKYTDKVSRIFNIEAYIKGCKKANRKPKVL